MRPVLLLCLTPYRSRPMSAVLLLGLILAVMAPTLAPTEVGSEPSQSGHQPSTQEPPGAPAIGDVLSPNRGTGRGQADLPPTGTPPAAVAPVAGSEVPACTAALEAARSRQVCALLAAPVVRIAAEPGDVVSTGDTLVWLDDRELRLTAERAGLAHQEVAARLQSAVQLHAQGGLSTQDLETLRFQAETALLRWEQTRLELSRAAIQAPMSGIVTEGAIQVGDLTHRGQVLCRVIDPKDLKATLYLPLESLRRLRPGQIVRGRPLSEPGLTVRGTIRRLGPGLDPSSGCGPVEVLFPRAGRRLRPGTLVQVELAAALPPP